MGRALVGLALLLLGAGCATTRRVSRAEAAEELERLGAPRGEGQVTLGVARREGEVVYPYLVSSQEAKELHILEKAVEWIEVGTGVARREPLQALAWVEWRAPGSDRWSDVYWGGGIGAVGGAAVGLGLTALLGHDTCVGGAHLQGVGVFGPRCFPGWTRQLGLWGGVGAVGGAVLGGLLGWVLGHHLRLEFDEARR